MRGEVWRRALFDVTRRLERVRHSMQIDNTEFKWRKPGGVIA